MASKGQAAAESLAFPSAGDDYAETLHFFDVGESPPPANAKKRLSLRCRFSRQGWACVGGTLLLLGTVVGALVVILLREKVLTVPNGAVAADQGKCSDMGVAILQGGGNAIDAAVSTALCLGVVNPFASGIGGGGFMMVWANASVEVIDFREEAPGATTADMFFGNQTQSQEGGRAVAIPGELRGLKLAHERWGVKPWAELVQPAVQMARDGFKVSKLFGERLDASRDKILEYDGLRRVFGKNEISTLEEGDTLVRNDLAEVLDRVAADGPDAVYTGDIGQSIVDAVAAHGGHLTMEDLAQYRPKIRDAIETTYNDFKVFGAPPPSAGGAAVAMVLNVMNFAELSSQRKDTPVIHRMVEAFKFAFAERARLADPAFASGISSDVDEIVSKKLAFDVFEKIRETPQDPTFYTEVFSESRDSGTSHFSIVDIDRNAVAMTSTINHSFGSKVMTDTGILLNNQMNDFAVGNGTGNAFGLADSEVNQPAPFKRPLSSMSPTIILDPNNRLFISTGGSGGPTIITALLQVLFDVINFGRNVLEAVQARRLHHQLFPDELAFESGYASDVREDLVARGHTMAVAEELADGHKLGNVQIVLHKSDGKLNAASDPRKDGRPAGY